MTEWTAPPEPVTWKLEDKDKPGQAIMHGGLAYTEVTVRAPSSGDVLKATAVQGVSGLERTLRLIAAASKEQVPYEVLQRNAHWINTQISDYFDEFAGAPAPDPLESWRRARRDAAKAEAAAELKAEQVSAGVPAGAPTAS